MMMFMNHGESSCSSNNKDRSSSAFTASQWHELEQQALIFKYMSKGLPIPPDLIYAIRRSCPPPLIPHHPNILGRLDLEPGRCRRTDGKKWRCSKKAFPDSKYCERHMHRGKNRSRKPVEIDISSSSSTTTTSSFKSIPTQTHLSLEHGSLSSPHKDYRLGEHGFFSEPSRNTHVDVGGWRSTVTVAAKSPAWMTSDLERIQGREEQQQRCFVVGDDFKPLKVERGEEGEEKQKLRHFFDEDEWHSSRKNRVPSWIDIEQDLSNATQLSISIPAAPSHHDFMKWLVLVLLNWVVVIVVDDGFM
ncbi:Growth-regulating factor 4 [Acorus gramineus]|uniref:Growth-regulating factor n=1 Tax=Acorus gramineus TaxID=55184 RepID=A0AAV9BVF3_ACOGR|nr:Growth-regulating factor 4 [Acorus gramineus]